MVDIRVIQGKIEGTVVDQYRYKCVSSNLVSPKNHKHSEDLQQRQLIHTKSQQRCAEFRFADDTASLRF